MEKESKNQPLGRDISRAIRELLAATIVMLVTSVFVVILGTYFVLFPEKNTAEITENETVAIIPPKPKSDLWQAPDVSTIPNDEQGKQIKYGRELVVHTAEYLGPKGSVMQISNGLNCQNCHLDAGAKPWGNNYGAVASTYPKYRARNGAIENIDHRINDCMERSLNGKALDTSGKELKAIKAYILWLGKDVPKGEKPKGSGIYELAHLDRAADPVAGKAIYAQKCQSCHQPNGQGVLNPTQTAYTFPPLWGKHSYNDGAGLYRISRLAGYVKYNMPQGASYENPQLSDEEAWDVAAFINSQVRPEKDISHDWPKIAEKPIDHPFAPFADKFSEKQHKFGPFKPIVEAKKRGA